MNLAPKYSKGIPLSKEQNGQNHGKLIVGKLSAFQRKQERTAYLFIAAPMILFVLFTLIPVIQTIYLSFTNYNIVSSYHFTGIKNYIRIFADGLFWKYASNTLYYSVMYVPICFVLSLVAAMLLGRAKMGVTAFRLCFYFPVVSSAVATAAIWIWLLNYQSGGLNVILSIFGIKGPAWLANAQYSMIAIVIITVWASLGSNMMIFLAGLKGIPDHLYESAKIDGASFFQEFFHITLPGLGPTSFFVSITLIIGAFQLFDQVFVLTQGGPGGSTKTLVYYIYDQGFTQFQMGYASAISFVLFIVILIASLLNIRISRDSSDLV